MNIGQKHHRSERGQTLGARKGGWLYVFLWVPLVASDVVQHDGGVVFGRAMNSTQDSSVVAGQEVLLYQYIGGKEVLDFRMDTVTDSRGQFVFEGLDVGDQYAYYPLTVFGDVEYRGKKVTPSGSSLRHQSDIVLFEPTYSDSAIRTIMHHIIIEPGAGFLNVREVLFFANRDNHTYVGIKPAGSGKNIVLQIEIPPKATELQLEGDLMSCCVIMNRNNVFDTMPLKPGTRQAILNYVLPYKGKEANLTKTIENPTEAFDIFLLDLQFGGFTMRTDREGSEIMLLDQFEEPEPFRIRGKKYSRYDVGSLARRTTFTLAIANLPAPRGDYRWLAPVILVLIMLAGYFRNRKLRLSRHTQPVRGEGRIQSTDRRNQ